MTLHDVNRILDLNQRTSLLPKARRLELKKLALEKWLDCGTMEKASDALSELGYTKKDGSPVHPHNIRQYSHDFIISSPQEAREMFQKHGEFLDTEEGNHQWVWYLVTVGAKHKKLRGKVNFIRWTVNIGIYKKAFEYFKTTFNLKDEDYHAFDEILGDD